MNNLTFKVNEAGTLLNPKSEYFNNSGVYFWVYGDQIIYVGTTVKNFSIRIQKHQKLFREGNRTIWFPSQDETIYDIIQKIPINKIDNEFYRNKVYIPNKKTRWYPDKSLNNKEPFEKYKNLINVNNYLKKLEFYVIPITIINNTSYKNFIECIESYIQMSLYMNFNLFRLYDGQHISKQLITKSTKFGALGKQEKSANNILNTFQNIDNIILEDLPENLYKNTNALFSEGEQNGYQILKKL